MIRAAVGAAEISSRSSTPRGTRQEIGFPYRLRWPRRTPTSAKRRADIFFGILAVSGRLFFSKSGGICVLETDPK